MKFPNLFIAGAPKCGTTSLAYWLGQHPEIFAPAEKEPGFFGTDIEFTGNRTGLTAYAEHYRDWGKERYAIDATPAYLISQTAAAEIAKARPDAQIVIAVRNPVEAVHSNFHHAKFRLTETLDTLEEGLDAEATRKAEGFVPKFGSLQSLLYTEIYRYQQNIGRFREHFPSEQVHIVMMEDMRSDPAAVLERLLTQLALSTDNIAGFDFEARNEAGHGRFDYLTRLAIYPPAWIGKIAEKIVSRERRVAIRGMIRKINTTPAKNPPLSDATRARLEDVFRQDIAWLERELDRDLSHWFAQKG